MQLEWHCESILLRMWGEILTKKLVLGKTLVQECPKKSIMMWVNTYFESEMNVHMWLSIHEGVLLYIEDIWAPSSQFHDKIGSTHPIHLHKWWSNPTLLIFHTPIPMAYHKKHRILIHSIFFNFFLSILLCSAFLITILTSTIIPIIFTTLFASSKALELQLYPKTWTKITSNQQSQN